MLKPTTAGIVSESSPSVSTSSACTVNTYRCGSPGGGAAPPYAFTPKSLRACTPTLASSVPAPVGSSVTSAGMSNSTQCQKPLPVGASGSKQVTAKLFVSAGNPDQRRCGDLLPPSKPQSLKTCSCGSLPPSVMSSLSTVNDGTSGRYSCGSGGFPAMADLLIGIARR